MIRETDHLIAKYLETGQYFADAQDWYATKYLGLYTIRSLFLVLTLVLAGASMLMVHTYMLNIESKKFPSPIFAYDETKYFPYIKPLAQVQEPPLPAPKRWTL